MIIHELYIYQIQHFSCCFDMVFPQKRDDLTLRNECLFLVVFEWRSNGFNPVGNLITVPFLSSVLWALPITLVLPFFLLVVKGLNDFDIAQ